MLRVVVSEMTYTVLSGTLNSSIPYHHHCCVLNVFSFLVMLLYMNKCMPAVSTLVCISQYTKDNIYYYYYEYLIYVTQINRKRK